MKFLWLIFILVVWAEDRPACTLVTDQKVNYDLRPLMRTSGQDYEVSAGSTRFHLNICHEVLDHKDVSGAGAALEKDGRWISLGKAVHQFNARGNL